MKRSRLWLLLPIGCIAAVAAAASGAAEPQSPATFAEAVDVELVTVDVWVIDGNGRPVRGLAASDFELRHDGEPVAISHFAEVHGGAVAAPVAAAGAPPSAAPMTPPPDAQGYLILYFDQLHLIPRDFGPVLEGVARLLGTMPAERILVLRQDRNLQIEVPFGSSREDLDAGLRRLAGSRVLGDSTEGDQLIAAMNLAWQESEQLAGTISIGMGAAAEGQATAEGGPRAAVGSSGGGGGMEPSACETYVDRMEATMDAWVRERNHRTATTLHHLHQAGAILAGLPGVKTLVYLSDALETDPAYPVAAAIGAICPGQRLELTQPEMPRELLALTRHLNTNQVTIYSLQSIGLRMAGSSAAGSRNFTSGGVPARVSSAFDSAQRNSQRSGMGVLADETGGRLVVNQNDLAGELERIGHEMQSFYSLAYRPPPGGSVGEHRIAVALDDRSQQARYRRGYREKNGEQRLRELLEGVLYLGITANPLNVRLGAGEARPRGGDRYVLPLHTFVPVDRLVFLGPEDKPAAELRMQVLARNAGNPRGAWQSKAFRVIRPAVATGAADLAIELELDAGTNVVAVALRDEASRVTSLVSTTLEIGP